MSKLRLRNKISKKLLKKKSFKTFVGCPNVEASKQIDWLGLLRLINKSREREESGRCNKVFQFADFLKTNLRIS